ncbi:iron-containing alcohol dehydrogenase [Magnetospira sp. QH-2]|uniref:iron-containing alcohol dehydrogenase n=1 Tax=Magnetospira sp. (strain QH-2) TaxID=1288970 RepID=UPI0003E8178B|nr:iron-containing alcohol dehydrogenase [Magnetospira sp. QH-2]CCQ72828.1 putative Alcohol dehydrogenase 4 [Magnetospira sp. QH-2]
MIVPFEIARLPRIVFGSGSIARIPKEAAALGRHALIVTGSRSFRETTQWPALLKGLADEGLAIADMAVADEPSPDIVDAAVSEFKNLGVEVVIAVGGGSALDAAKAIAGLLVKGNSVMDHLEGVGRGIPYEGPALPFIAVPTTAGTGSEATKNAVLSHRGPDGFKKSFRDEQLVARVAVLDPELLTHCPRSVIAANGMDAFTQLLESVVSTRSNPLTDALGWSGLEAFRDGFWDMLDGTGDKAVAGREKMLYASLLSGINLAQTGLGSVHGLASPMGSLFPIPHGVVCGTLVGAATEVNIQALGERMPESPALPKYARAGSLLTRSAFDRDEDARTALITLLNEWTETLELPRLSQYGMDDARMDQVVAASGGNSMKTNPLVLTPEEIERVVRARL